MINSSSGASLLALMGLAFLVACAAPTSGPARKDGARNPERTTGASLFDQLEDARKIRGTEETTQPPSDQERKLAAMWAKFLRNDVAWETEREEWLRGGPAARALLVENLLRAMMRARDAGEGRLFHRCREELLLEKDLATHYLVEALASGSGDSVTRNLCSETLAFFGATSAKTIIAVWPQAPAEGRRALLTALKLLRAAEARGLLEEVACSREDFKLRIEALDGLGKLADVASAPVCVTCLKDADPSVRKFAAIAASHIGSGGQGLLPAVLEAWSRAETAGEQDVVSVLHRAARVLAGREYGPDPSRWPVHRVGKQP
ncbi:MAG: HEAT repeat domain-containing protein [Planctomycetes bacterium]|nr:HEAT repeat domain-containing protein [Planctomycetota bacterium]